MHQLQTDILNIITITKDDFDGVCQTIASTNYLRSTYNIQQIIIDSSSVETSEKIKSFISSEINITYCHTLPAGISSAFNLGIHKADAKWVWFLNGGDMIHPEATLEIVYGIVAKSGADIILFQTEYKEQKVIPKFPPLWLMWPPVISWISHPSSFVKKELFVQYGMFNVKYTSAMDYEFWLRVLSKKTIVDMISMPLALFDENGISSTMSSISKKQVRKATFLYSLALLKIQYVRMYIFIKNLF